MKRGEVWYVNLDPSIGSEINKKRPCVIVNRDSIGRLPLKIIVPITTWKDAFNHSPWLLRIAPDPRNGLDKQSAADTFQVRSISEKLLINKIGELSKTTMKEIDIGLRLSLKLD